MKKKIVSLILTLLMAFTMIPLGIAGEDGEIENVRAIQLGMVGWNTSVAYWDNVEAWRYDFSVGTDVIRVQFPDPYEWGGINWNFKMQELMADTYMFDLVLKEIEGDDPMVIGIQEVQPILAGEVQSVSDDSLTIKKPDGSIVTHAVDAATEYYQINEPGNWYPAGGSTVKAIDPSELIGQPAKVFDNNAVYLTFVMPFVYEPPVSGEPGVRTIRNLLENAFAPLGTTQYVYGGGYTYAGGAAIPNIKYPSRNTDYMGTGEGNNLTKEQILDEYGYLTYPWEILAAGTTKSIGVPQKQVEFFFAQDTTFTDTYPLTGPTDWTKSYRGQVTNANGGYPYLLYTGGRVTNELVNHYSYAGSDCAGYVSWAVFQAFNDKSWTDEGFDGETFTIHSSWQARMFELRGYGTRTYSGARGANLPSTSFEDTPFKPGDIFSMSGHVFMVVGVCEDGSAVIIHCSTGRTRDGLGDDAGIQLSAVRASGQDDTGDCQATELCNYYMSKFYPEWYSRYSVRTMNHSSYFVGNSGGQGLFSWFDDERGMLDPDGYRNMTADEILKDLFYEIDVTGVETGNGQANVLFDIASANGKGYSVYLSDTGVDGPYTEYNNVNYNAKGVHIKGLANGKTYYVYIEYSGGDGTCISMPIAVTPGKK